MAEASPSPTVVVLARLPLEMWDELANGDLLGHLLVEVVAVEHHRLQNGQGPLQDRGVHGRLVHEARYLQEQAGHSRPVVSSAERREGAIRVSGAHAPPDTGETGRRAGNAPRQPPPSRTPLQTTAAITQQEAILKRRQLQRSILPGVSGMILSFSSQEQAIPTHTAVPPYPHGLGSRIPLRCPNPQMLKSFIFFKWYLHVTYISHRLQQGTPTHPLIRVNSA